MATLVSPGVSVTVTDESFYASAGQGTIPLVVFASAANKLQSGSSTAYAPGTLASNANKLYLMTSQRDVLQTFGSPLFYSVGGSQQYDNELNEVGLFSLYQYLGIANTAYALRADLDLSQLQPSASAPTGSPTTGDYWLDLTQTTWGLFRANGNPNSAYAWQAKTPLVITNRTDLEMVIQGDVATKITSGSAPVLNANGSLVINDVTVSLLNGDSLSDIVSKINNTTNLTQKSIYATIYARTEKIDLTASNYGDSYSIRIICRDIGVTMDLTGSTPSVLTALGFATDTPPNVVVPSESFGNEGDYAIDAISIDEGDIAPKNKVWEKITLTTSSTTRSWWFKVGSVDGLQYPNWGWREAVPRVITGTVANPTFTPGESCSIQIGTQGPYTITVPAAISPATTATLTQMVTAINTVLNVNSLNAVATAYSVGNSRYLRITNYDGTDTWFNDDSTQAATQTPWRDAGILPTQTYYGSVTGTVANPSFVAATLKTASAVPNNPGSGYAVGDLLTVSGGVHSQSSVLQVASLQVVAAVSSNGGSNYDIGDTLTFTGANYTTPVILTVTSVSGNVITGLEITQAGQYTGGSVPTNPVSPSSTSDAGINATITLTWGVATVNVTVPGVYTTYPTNPASVTGGSGSNATFDLTQAYNTSNTFTIDVGSGPVTVNVPATPNNTLSGVVDAINAAFPEGPIVASATTDSKLRIVNSNATSFTLEDVSGTPLNGAGIKVGYVFGRGLTYQGYSPSLTVPSELSMLAPTNVWINTTPAGRGANMVVKRYIDGAWYFMNRSPNTGTIPMYLNDSFADAGFGANKQVGSIYMRYNADGNDPVEADHQLYRWDGTAWTELEYTPSMLEPAGPPANGTLWYSTSLRYDIMVSDGQVWKGYRNFYPATDINGPILSATQPTEQSNGLPLVDNDIWVDTSENDVFTAYRYDTNDQIWRLIDNTDHSSPAGIIFADARNNATGLSNGSELPEDMVVSDYVDPDAPDALLYPMGLLLMNTRYSTNNVKEWVENKFPQLPAGSRDRWVTASGNAPDGTPWTGYKSQRQMVVRALQAVLAANQDCRAESTFFNLLSTPGYPECIDEMVTLNTDKKEIAFIIGDTPARLAPDGTSIQSWATNAENVASNGDDGLVTNNPYVGLYYPWALSTNLDGSEVFVPPSMMALRTYAYNDQVAYPWFAPAGFNRGLVTGVTSVGYLLADGTYQPLTLNQGQRDVMYINKINPIAYIPNRGLVVYGQKTLNPVASALDRVNVARLINYLKYQLDNLAKPFLFEPNDKQTRQAVTATFNSFMGNLIGLRALYDFAVVCDESNNTPIRIDRNELWIDVAIKPEKAIEFIYIPIRILNTGDPLPNGSQNPT